MLLLALVALVVVRRRGVAAVALLAVIVVANLALIAIARSAFGGVIPMQEWRYYTSLAIWVPLLKT